MRSRHVSLPRPRWRTTPGILRARSQPGLGEAPQLGDLVEHREPRLLALPGDAASADTPSADGATSATTVSWATMSPGRRSRSPAMVPAHGAVTTASIFIALMTSRPSPGRTASPVATRTSTTVPPIGLRTASWPGPTASPESVARGRRAASSDAGVERGERRASAPSAAGQLGCFGEQRRAGVTGAHRRVIEDRQQLGPVGRQPGEVERLDGAPGAVDRGGDVRRRRRADHLGQQRVELRRRRVAGVAGGVDAHARSGRLLVAGQRAGAGGDEHAPARRTRGR